MKANRMRQQIRSFAIRVVIVVPILLALVRVYGTAIVSPMLPALTWVVEAVDDRLRVDQAVILNRSADTVIQLKVTPIHMLNLGDRMLFPDTRLLFDPSILLGSALQPIVILLAIIFAWPVARLWAFPARLLASLPMMVVLLLVNVPLAFVGVMQDFRVYLPAAPVTPLIYWNDFLQTGGPLPMAIAASILVVSVADQWVCAPEKPLPNGSGDTV